MVANKNKQPIIINVAIYKYGLKNEFHQQLSVMLDLH